jgi:hypothetical protein
MSGTDNPLRVPTIIDQSMSTTAEDTGASSRQQECLVSDN